MTRKHCGLYTAHCDTGYAWCGPTAIKALTGKSIEVIEDAVLHHRVANPPPRHERGKRGARVKAMWWREIGPVLTALGVANTSILCDHGLTLAQWVRTHRGHAPVIILITGHFVAVHNGMLVDSQNRQPIPFAQYRHKRTRVQSVTTMVQ